MGSSDRIGRRELAAKLFTGIGLVALVIGLEILLQYCLPLTDKSTGALIRGQPSMAMVFLFVPYVLYLLVLSLIYYARRLHDVGRTGWWLLGWVVFENMMKNVHRSLPEGSSRDLLGAVWFLADLAIWGYLLFWPGDKGENRYGAPAEMPASGIGRFGFVVRNRLRSRFVLWGAAVIVAVELGTHVCAGTYTGFRGFMHMMAGRHPKYPQKMYSVRLRPPEEVNARLDGLVRDRDYDSFRDEWYFQSVTFTNATVRRCRELGSGFTELELGVERGGGALDVLVYMPSSRFGKLPRDPVPGDRILKITGSVFNDDILQGEAEQCGVEVPMSPCYGNAVWLGHIDEFDAAWAEEGLPKIDLTRVSGEELVKFAMSIEASRRKAVLERLFGPAVGRYYTFPECRVAEIGVPADRPQMKIAVLDPESGETAFHFNAPAVSEHMQELFWRLHKGMRLKTVRAMVTERIPRGFTGSIWMNDVSIEEEEESVPLPEFDTGGITGVGLVALLKSVERRLSLEEVKGLEKKLDGKRLTFEPMRLEPCRTEDAEPGEPCVRFFSADFGECGFRLEVRLGALEKEASFSAERSFSGTVEAPSGWFDDRDHNGYVIHMKDGTLR